MKKKLKRILVATSLMTVVLTAGILCSCGNDNDAENRVKNQGYTCCVTYYANGGTFGSGIESTYTLVKPESLTPAPGFEDKTTNATVKIPSRKNYELVGEDSEDVLKTQSWFLAETDEKGEIVYEGEGDARAPKLASDTAWNFTKDKVTSDITLVACWKEVYQYAICITEMGADGKTEEKELRSFPAREGAEIVSRLYNRNDEGQYVRSPENIRLNVSGYTFLDFYTESDLSDEHLLDFSFTHPGSVEKPVYETDPETGELKPVYITDPETGEQVIKTEKENTVRIYAKYLKGRYTFVKEGGRLPELEKDSTWYLLSDIDFMTDGYDELGNPARVPTEWEALEEFTGTIYGNGYTIRNISVTSQVVKPSAGASYVAHSIFGKMNGIISDLALENVTLSVQGSSFVTDKIPGEQKVSFLASEFGSNGLFENVTLGDNCTVDLVNQLNTNGGNRYEATFDESQNYYWEAPADAPDVPDEETAEELIASYETLSNAEATVLSLRRAGIISQSAANSALASIRQSLNAVRQAIISLQKVTGTVIVKHSQNEFI